MGASGPRTAAAGKKQIPCGDDNKKAIPGLTSEGWRWSVARPVVARRWGGLMPGLWASPGAGCGEVEMGGDDGGVVWGWGGGGWGDLGRVEELAEAFA